MNKSLQNLIDKHDTISFDIFDTLVKRNVKSPSDLFYVIQRRYNKKHKNNQIHDFPAKRRRAMELAKPEDKSEIIFDDIYRIIDYSKKTATELKKIELQTELDYCQRNIAIDEIFDYCQKKQVICISDMYFGEKFIRKMLQKCGYNIDKIYVSSEYGYTKRDGELFEIVKKDLKAAGSDILHIGNDKVSDFISPMKHGLAAWKIKTVPNHFQIGSYRNNEYDLNKKGELDKDIIDSVINDDILKCANYYEKFGYQVMGPFIYSFVRWIYTTAKENNIKSLLFCARDTWMEQKVFNELYGKEISNCYFYVSRKSVYIVSLYLHNDFDSLSKMVLTIDHSKRTGKKILSSIGVNFKQTLESKKIFDLDKKYVVTELADDQNFHKFYDKYLKDYINKKGKEQSAYLKKYIDDVTVKDKIALVDNGWRGTTQAILMDFLDCPVNGLYIGARDKQKSLKKGNYYTFMFDEDMNYIKRLGAFLDLFELFLSAQHGTTLGYTSSRKGYYITAKAPAENPVITDIQNGAMKFCDDIKKYNDDIKSADGKEYFEMLLKVGTNPSWKSIKELGQIRTDFTSNDKVIIYRGLSHYLTHPHDIREDYRASAWKTGFLMKLGKLPLPYDKIFYRKYLDYVRKHG